MTCRTLRILSISFFVLASVASSPAAQKKGMPHKHLKPETAALIERLKSGGHVLVVRHERTNAFIPDDREFEIGSCETQRNLSVAGHANAVENGAVIRFLKLPVGNVFASPMCRTLETARLMFGRVESNEALYGRGTDPDTARKAFEALILEGTRHEQNTVLVTHLGTYSAALGGHLAEGDTAVFSASGDKPEFLGVVPANGWNDVIIDTTMLSGRMNAGHQHN